MYLAAVLSLFVPFVHRSHHRVEPPSLNRILFTDEEVQTSAVHSPSSEVTHSSTRDRPSQYSITLPSVDYRVQHILSVLGLNVNDRFKAGILDKGLGWAKIESINEDDMRFLMEPELQTKEKPPIDLILACPRPLVLHRLLPVISCFGVGRLVICGGEKVNADYWGSHLFREKNKYMVLESFCEGLSQAGCDYHVPEVTVRKSLRKLLVDLDAFFPPAEYARVICHPIKPSDDQWPGKESTDPTRLMTYSDRFMAIEGDERKICLAIGPEGGWTHDEVSLFLEKGFTAIHLGDRILKVDMAVPAILGLADEWLALRNIN